MSLPNQFEEYLKQNCKVSGRTIRNYRADLAHFFSWCRKHLNQAVTPDKIESLLPHFTGTLVAAYKSHHVENKIPESTTNRRLSTLRHFARYTLQEGLTTEDPTVFLSNIKPWVTAEKQTQLLIKSFEEHLVKEGVSPLTIKNYLSDVRQFLFWANKMRAV